MSNPAARLGDQVLQTAPHCHAPIHPPALVPTPSAHPAMPLALIVGAPTVLIGGLPAAPIGNPVTCVGPLDTTVKGSATVMVGGRPAVRMGDMTAHGGVIVTGMPTVMIGG